MLVLQRKLSETIHVNGPCVVTVVDLQYAKVRLGIEAEKHVEIWRGEIIAQGKTMPRAESTVIGRAEAQQAGMGEEWAALRRLVDGGK